MGLGLDARTALTALTALTTGAFGLGLDAAFVGAAGLGLGLAALYPAGILTAQSKFHFSPVWISRFIVGR